MTSTFIFLVNATTEMTKLNDDQKRAALEKPSVMACLFCGKPMELDRNIGWFCGIDSGGRYRRPCFHDTEALYLDAYLRDDTPGIDLRSPKDWQGVIIAAIIEPSPSGLITVMFQTVRGRRGGTNLRISSLRTLSTPSIPNAELPEFCKDRDWTWANWAYPFRFDQNQGLLI